MTVKFAGTEYGQETASRFEMRHKNDLRADNEIAFRVNAQSEIWKESLLFHEKHVKAPWNNL